MSKRILFSGKVQGVGFRFVLKEKAKLLGLKGWVKNLDDGKVETVLHGSEEMIEKIIQQMQESFSIAKIESFLANESEFDEFSIIL